MWINIYFPLIKDNKHQRNKNFRKDIRKGIPVPVRGQAWQLMIGNHLRITPFLFQML